MDYYETFQNKDIEKNFLSVFPNFSIVSKYFWKTWGKFPMGENNFKILRRSMITELNYNLNTLEEHSTGVNFFGKNLYIR